MISLSVSFNVQPDATQQKHMHDALMEIVVWRMCTSRSVPVYHTEEASHTAGEAKLFDSRPHTRWKIESRRRLGCFANKQAIHQLKLGKTSSLIHFSCLQLVGTVILPQDWISPVASKCIWTAKSHLKMNFISLDTKYKNWHLFWRKIAQAHFSS